MNHKLLYLIILFITLGCASKQSEQSPQNTVVSVSDSTNKDFISSTVADAVQNEMKAVMDVCDNQIIADTLMVANISTNIFDLPQKDSLLTQTEIQMISIPYYHEGLFPNRMLTVRLVENGEYIVHRRLSGIRTPIYNIEICFIYYNGRGSMFGTTHESYENKFTLTREEIIGFLNGAEFREYPKDNVHVSYLSLEKVCDDEVLISAKVWLTADDYVIQLFININLDDETITVMRNSHVIYVNDED